MGGEQEAVLRYDFMELVELFELVDKKEWVRKFLETEDHEDNIDLIFDEEFSNSDELVMNFLYQFHLSIVFDNNCDWSVCYIGFIIDDYENFISPANMNTVKNFCEKYNLSKPTFFAGIIGEFE